MNWSKGVLALGFAIIFCLFLTACGGGGSTPPPPPRQLVITSSTMPNGAVNAPYNNNVTATGGSGTYTWAIISGDLPPGLSLNTTTSFISGTPVQPFGKYTFTVQVTDGAGTTASKELSIYIEGAPVISPATLPTGAVGTPYSQTLSATGGLAPYTWCVLAGGACDPTQSALAAIGLHLNTSTGEISGTPTKPSSGTSFTIQAVDSETIPASGQIAYKVSVLGITTSTLPAATYNIPYTGSLSASGGKSPYTWTIVKNTLPPGLSLNAATCTNSTQACVISGTPTQTGTYPFTVQVTDSENPAAAATVDLSITVNLQYTNANLTGNYAFSFTGYKNGSLVVMGGAFVSNGDGTFKAVQDGTGALCNSKVSLIYTGCLDYNDGTGEALQGGTNPIPQFIVADPTSSKYDIGPNGLGTMTLVTDQGNTFNFQVDILSDGSGTLIENNTDPAERGSGVIKKQVVDDFKISSVNGKWALAFSGTDPMGQRYAGAGGYATNPITQLDIDCGDKTWKLPNGNCPADANDAGTTSTQEFKGTYSGFIDANTGRGNFAKITYFSGTTLLYTVINTYYIVSHNEFILVSTNPVQATDPYPLVLWSARRQLTSVNGWDNTALSPVTGSVAGAVVEANAVSGTAADVTAGLFKGSGVSGNNCQGGEFDPATFSFDENQGGTSSLQQSSTGTFCIDNVTGRVTLQNFTPLAGVTGSVFYMIAANQGFLVGTDPAVTSGYFEAQGGSAFSNISISGSYSGGTVNPVVSAVTDSVNWMYADAAGNINGTQYTSAPGGPGGPTDFDWTYQVDNTGRAVVSGSYPAVMYVVSPTKVILLPTSDTDPALWVLKSAPSN